MTTEPVFHELNENNVLALASKHNIRVTSLICFLVDLFGAESLPLWMRNWSYRTEKYAKEDMRKSMVTQ